jgi:LmbE family N-acetylglucosaminyl deacetylase
VRFLGYPDDWEYVKNGQTGINEEQASKELTNISAEYDLILTHYEDGDYGHPHHMFVNQAANKNGIPKVYFASTFNYNTEYVVTETVAVDELPLHKDVIEEFTDRDTGRYIVTPEAELIIKKNK